MFERINNSEPLNDTMQVNQNTLRHMNQTTAVVKPREFTYTLRQANIMKHSSGWDSNMSYVSGINLA